MQALCEQAGRDGPQTVEAKINRRGRAAFWGRLEVAVFRAEGRALLLVRVARQRRLQQTERTLAHGVRRFGAVFANATIGIIVCDRPGRIVLANVLAGQFFGYESDELLDQRIEILVPATAGRPHEQLRDTFNAHP